MRLLLEGAPRSQILGFSPVAGIQWVETLTGGHGWVLANPRFSPVAGIQWVETLPTTTMAAGGTIGLKFQSRCRDSVG